VFCCYFLFRGFRDFCLCRFLCVFGLLRGIFFLVCFGVLFVFCGGFWEEYFGVLFYCFGLFFWVLWVSVG